MQPSFSLMKAIVCSRNIGVVIKILHFFLVSTCIFTRKSLSDNYWMLVISVYIHTDRQTDRHAFHHRRVITNLQLTIYPCGLLAQWIEHCTGIARSWARFPFKITNVTHVSSAVHTYDFHIFIFKVQTISYFFGEVILS